MDTLALMLTSKSSLKMNEDGPHDYPIEKENHSTPPKESPPIEGSTPPKEGKKTPIKGQGSSKGSR